MITQNDIERMATLCKLEIKAEEMPLYINEMQELLAFAESINNTVGDTDSFNAKPLDFNLLREDRAQPSYSSDEILSNAKETKNGFFELRKRA